MNIYELHKMNIRVFYIIIMVLIGCSANKKTEESTDSLGVISQNSTRIPETHDASDIDDNDCVFNNDFKGLTTEWLSELNIVDFIWREDLHGALIPKGQDTTFLSRGGCHHFGTSVELWIRTKVPDISDSIFWVSKALELTDNYKLDDYSDMIRKGKLDKFHSDENSVTYEVHPDSQTDNLVYGGINIVSEKGYVRLSISKYFN